MIKNRQDVVLFATTLIITALAMTNHTLAEGIIPDNGTTISYMDGGVEVPGCPSADLERTISVSGGEVVAAENVRYFDFDQFNVKPDQTVNFVVEKLNDGAGINSGIALRVNNTASSSSKIDGIISLKKENAAIPVSKVEFVMFNKKGLEFGGFDKNNQSHFRSSFLSNTDLYLVTENSADLPFSKLTTDQTNTLPPGKVSLKRSITSFNKVIVHTRTLELVDQATLEGTTNIKGEESVSITTSESVALRKQSRIFSSSAESDAGQVVIETPLLKVTDNSVINSRTSGAVATAGDISLKVDNLDVRGESSISVSSLGAGGAFEARGGNIAIEGFSENRAKLVLVDSTSKIFARAVDGKGGNIKIVTKQFLGDRENIDASSQNGSDGVVEISTLENNEVPVSEILPADFSTNAQLNDSPCQRQDANNATSSFVVNNRVGVAASPDTMLFADLSRIRIVDGEFVQVFPGAEQVKNHMNDPGGDMDCIRG